MILLTIQETNQIGKIQETNQIGDIMKKFILLIALSVLFYSVPGNAVKRKKQPRKQKIATGFGEVMARQVGVLREKKIELERLVGIEKREREAALEEVVAVGRAKQEDPEAKEAAAPHRGRAKAQNAKERLEIELQKREAAAQEAEARRTPLRAQVAEGEAVTEDWGALYLYELAVAERKAKAEREETEIAAVKRKAREASAPAAADMAAAVPGVAVPRVVVTTLEEDALRREREEWAANYPPSW